MARFLLLINLLFPVLILAQSNKNALLWTPKSSAVVSQQAGERRIHPQSYQTFALDLSHLRSRLAAAPMERTPAAKNQAPVVDIPLPSGETIRFNVWESPIMEKGLADRYPEIRTYAGRALDNKSITIRFDLTPQGFHAMLFTQQYGTVFIDPLYHGQDQLYQVYAKKDFIPQANDLFSCAFQDKHESDLIHSNTQSARLFGDCNLHTYRLALSCNGEYAQFHGGTVPLVLGAMVTSMNRINGVYENDFAVRMNLIANNDTLIFLDAQTDPFSDDAGLLGGENQAVTDDLIGDDGYDVGHIFGIGGGGYAYYAAVCSSGGKAFGYTGLGSPVGDPFDIDYVAHEFGHQFSGSHPHHGCGNNSSPSPTLVEPGSGSTIMAYAGICPDNVQSNSDAYFHGYNLAEMSNFVIFEGGQTCGEHTPLDNAPPVVTNSGQSFVIPRNTPFSLTATASDPDGDPITYCWEQFDTELSTQPPLPTNTGGPLFRTFTPSLSPTRYFPSLSALANGGPFAWEVLPTVARDMNFRVSVRDNAIGGSCSDQGDNVKISVDATSGPFVVTNPNALGIIWRAGGQEMVYWNTANTQFAPVNCTAVDILLSTDGGLSYPTVLATNVPNYGFYPVDVPNISTTTARVMVVANGNIFFDVSNNNFRINTVPSGFLLVTTPKALASCGSDALNVNVKVDSIGGFTGLVGLEVSGLPQGVVAAFDQNTVAAGGQAVLTLSGLNTATPGLYNIILKGNGNSGSQEVNFVLNIAPILPIAPVLLAAPVNNAVNTPILPLLAWNMIPNANTYTVQLADNPSFAPVLFQQQGIVTNQYKVTDILPIATKLYWRVKASNTCGEGAFSTAFQFTTSSVICTTLVSTGLPLVLQPLVEPDTILAKVYLPISSIVTDVNIPLLKGDHDYMRDLRFALISPSGTLSEVGGPICEGEQDFHFGFDDQATAPHNTIPCPPTDGGLYQPRAPLSVFNGENTFGEWGMLITDVQQPDGGALTNWSLEVCYVIPPNSGCQLGVTSVFAFNGNCNPNACITDLTLDITGATGQTAYLWNDGSRDAARFGLCAGNYTVTIVDAASCEVTKTFFVPSYNVLTVAAISTPAQGGNNGTATAVASGGTPPFTYSWSTGSNIVTIQQLAPGTYTVTATDFNGCTATTEVVVNLVSGLTEIPGLNTFRLMPNPTDGRFLVQLAFAQDEDVMVELYAVNGQRLQRSVHRGQQIEVPFDLTNQSAGVFFILVRTAEGSVSQPVVLRN